MRKLTVAGLKQSRLHLAWIELVFFVAGLLLFAAQMADGPEHYVDAANRAPLGSVAYYVDGLPLGLLALLVTIWFVPRLTLAWAVPLFWIASLTVEQPLAWQAMSLASALVLLRLLLATRPSPATNQQLPGLGHTYEQSYAGVPTRLSKVVLVAGLAMVPVLLVVHQFRIADVAAFEARATAISAEVLEVTDDDLVLRIDEGTRKVESPLDAPEAGDTITVLVDPDDPDRVVLLGHLQDPSWGRCWRRLRP